MPSSKKINLIAPLAQVLEEIGITTFTPIQQMALPFLFDGKDVIAQSSTGSGKTLAFALPLLTKIRLQKGSPQSLVLCPTRELADQVSREIRKFGRKMQSLKVVSLVGGQPFSPQKNSLSQGAHVVVGTPGRVLDHLRRNTLDVSDVEYFVLDEADRMLDMGFHEEVEAILAALPEFRQTALFSATYPSSIEQLSAAYQKNPEKLVVKNEEAPPAIRQLVLRTGQEKLEPLLWCLKRENPESALVFCNLKLSVANVASYLRSQGVEADALHGDLEQRQRDLVMAKFRNHSSKILVATDVAARGIDVKDLELVVNFELPKPDVFLHRIGRTGRAGKEGVAISLVEERESYGLKQIEKILGYALPWEKPQVEDLPPLAPPSMITLAVSGGRKDKIRPGDLLGALTGEAGLKAEQVGKIEIHDRFSFVAISTLVAHRACEDLRKGKIKGKRFWVEIVS